MTTFQGQAITVRRGLEQNVPAAVHCPPVQIPLDVVQFSSRNAIAASLATAVELALRVFPAIHSLAARLQIDPDTDEERVVIDVKVDADSAHVLAAKKAYTSEWVRACPAATRQKIRLLYHVA